ncbi:MAG: nuclear transport factor 2 family protein [Sphingomonadales bacterium]|nr:nuclear transport factor 2 family protein [Sphingomonadales bacterium]
MTAGERDAAIDALLAKQAITEVVYRVARGTDRGDLDLFASGFHADGEDYHGLANGPVANILANLGRSRLLFTQHAVSNVLVELDGDCARVESLFTSFHQSRDDAGQVWDEAVKGRYLDWFERRGGAWKIARRVVVWDWSRVEPAGESWFDRMRQRPGVDDRFVFGRRDRGDMVYTFELPEGLD